MIDDYELEDTACPRCGHSPIHVRDCVEINCDDGWIDLYEEDEMWYDPGDEEMCFRCHGTGVERWCPQCGLDLYASSESELLRVANTPSPTPQEANQ